MDTFEKLELEKRNIALANLKNEKVDFSSLEKVKFEDIDYQIVDDPIFDGYFIKGEQPDRISFTKQKILMKK